MIQSATESIERASRFRVRFVSVEIPAVKHFAATVVSHDNFQLLFLRTRWVGRNGGRQPKYFSRTHQGEVEVGANVFFSESLEKSRFIHHEQRLCMRAAEHTMFSAPAKSLV